MVLKAYKVATDPRLHSQLLRRGPFPFLVYPSGLQHMPPQKPVLIFD